MAYTFASTLTHSYPAPAFGCRPYTCQFHEHILKTRAGASADAGAPLGGSFLDDKYLDVKLKIENCLNPRDFERFQKIRRITKQIFQYTRDIESLLNASSSALFLWLNQAGVIIP